MAFIQFQSMNGLRKFKDAMGMNILARFYYIFTCRGERIVHKYLNQTIWPEIYAAPEPSQIIWGNLGYRPINRFFRLLIINALTIMIIGSGFYGLGYIRIEWLTSNHLRDSGMYLRKFDPADCAKQFDREITYDEAYLDFKGGSSKQTVGCYCHGKFSTMTTMDELFGYQGESQVSSDSEIAE